MAALSILQDPRYPKIVDRYQNDPLAFIHEVCGNTTSPDQDRLCNALINPNAKVSVVSGTSTGKTAIFGRVAIWHLLCFPYGDGHGADKIGSNTYIGSTNVKQVAEGVWKEMADTLAAISCGEAAWLRKYIDYGLETISIVGYKTQWFINSFAMPKNAAIAIAGKHRTWQLIIVDEAAGVGDDHFDVINGTQTMRGNRTLLASQGVRNSGFFYRTHTSLAKANGGTWDALEFNSENSPFCTTETLRDRLLECGGRDTNEYRVRVLGKFAEDDDKYLLKRHQVEATVGKNVLRTDDMWGWVVSVDIAAGEYRDDSVVSLSKVVGEGCFGENARRVHLTSIPVCSNSITPKQLTMRIIEIVSDLSNYSLQVDAGGMGLLVVSDLHDAGIAVEKVYWGKPCSRKTNKDRFSNLRAMAMVNLRDAIRQGRYSIDESIPREIIQKLLLQAAQLPFHFTSTGVTRYEMDSKADMARAGIKSPDVIDTMSFPFLEGVYYTVSDAALGKAEMLLDAEILAKARKLMDETE